MKFKTLFLAGLTAVTLFSCSDNNDVVDRAANEKAYFALKIAFPQTTTTKATTSAETGDGYQNGLATEQQFQSAAVILVNTANTVTDYVVYSKTDFAPEGDAAVDNNTVNPTSTSKNYLTKAAKLVTKGVAKVYVFLNPTGDVANKFAVGKSFSSTAALKADMTALTSSDITGTGSIANSGNFLMGNASDATQQTIDGTVKNPTTITVDVERAAVKLVENTATVTFNVTNNLGATSVTATIEKYDYNNLNKRSYLLKNTESRSDVGSIAGSYVVDPNFLDTEYKTTALTPWFENDFFTVDNQTVGKTFSTSPKITYCLENTMISNEQYENKTTSIVYQAKISVSGNASATFYTYKNVIYTSYAALATAYNTDYPNPDQQLNKVFAEADVAAAYTGPSYTANVKNFNTKLINKGIRCFYNGTCYYNWMIKHWSQDANLGRMEFGVVRNNVYYLAVTKILNIGEPWVPGGKEDPDPTPNPDEVDNASLVVSINVLPWTVRYNDIEF
jgi:hypothetical protein